MGNSESNSQPTQQPQACADPDGVDCAGDSDASQQVDSDASQQVDGRMPDFENVVSGAQRSAEGSVHEGLSPMEDFLHRKHGPQHQHSCDSPLLSEQSRSESRASALPEPSSCFGSHVSSSGVAFPWDQYPFPHPCSSPPGVGPDPSHCSRITPRIWKWASIGWWPSRHRARASVHALQQLPAHTTQASAPAPRVMSSTIAAPSSLVNTSAAASANRSRTPPPTNDTCAQNDLSGSDAT